METITRASYVSNLGVLSDFKLPWLKDSRGDAQDDREDEHWAVGEGVNFPREAVPASSTLRPARLPLPMRQDKDY